MIGQSASVLISLATMAATADREVSSLCHRQLSVGQKFEIQTADQFFRGELVDHSTGQCLLSSSADGANFTRPSTVYLLGATAGRQQAQMLVLMHEVKTGLKMELGLGDLEQRNRQVTSEVKAIRLVD